MATGTMPSQDRLRELSAGMDEQDLTLDQPVELVARTYHTVDHQVTYEEGEHYSTNYRPLISTVVACGFAALVDPTPPVQP